MRVPATVKRTPEATSGGMVSIMTAIARYVDPQTTYTTRSANATAAVDGRDGRGELTRPLCR